MKRLVLLALAILASASIAWAQTRTETKSARADTPKTAKAGINNPAIDMKGYLLVAAEAARHRESRRLTEDEFIQMSREFGTLIYDARSQEKYNELHIKGAINLSFPDITVESLQATFPDKNARILIYCNNNFVGEQKAFPTKIMTASLNLSTYIALYSYGYRNIHELGPLLDVNTTKLELVGSIQK
jgi:3-mercaptopyruvate sulfurtransferase SseA